MFLGFRVQISVEISGRLSQHCLNWVKPAISFLKNEHALPENGADGNHGQLVSVPKCGFIHGVFLTSKLLDSFAKSSDNC
jgi:hypothetical protein